MVKRTNAAVDQLMARSEHKVAKRHRTYDDYSSSYGPDEAGQAYDDYSSSYGPDEVGQDDQGYGACEPFTEDDKAAWKAWYKANKRGRWDSNGIPPPDFSNKCKD
jgi:hypothetical protein